MPDRQAAGPVHRGSSLFAGVPDGAGFPPPSFLPDGDQQGPAGHQGAAQDHRPAQPTPAATMTGGSGPLWTVNSRARAARAISAVVRPTMACRPRMNTAPAIAPAAAAVTPCTNALTWWFRAKRR